MGRVLDHAALCLAITLAGCGSPTEPEVCDGADAAFAGGVCLDLSAAAAAAEHHDVVEAEVERGLALIRPLLAVSDLRIRVLADAQRVIPEVGLGGFNPGTREVRIYLDPARPDLESILRTHLVPTLAHELHHLMRRRAVGYGSTLLEASVTEGLADHFSLEVGGGSPPPWSLALTEEQLDLWLPEVVARASGPYDHDAWFFGVGSDAPRWTGYAVGFELVRRYLDAHPGAAASGLVGEPASSFRPDEP